MPSQKKTVFILDRGAGWQTEIDARNLAEARQKINWDYANCGKITLVVAEYELVSEKREVINTDY